MTLRILLNRVKTDTLLKKNMTKFIKKEDLYKLLNSFLKDFEIIGPKQIANKGIFYEPLESIEDLYLGELFAIEPAKKFFLESSECLFHSGFLDGKATVQDAPLPDKRRIIIGLRPCEAKGLILLDKVFDSEYKDRSYINNREKSVIVGLACAKPDKSCFCTSMDGSPTGSRGMDVLLFAVEDGFIVEIYSDKGKEAFSSLGKEPDEHQNKTLSAYKQKRSELIGKNFKVPGDLSPIFESDYWDKVSFPCLSCGVCTYLCPTCHCFELVDEGRKMYRCNDGCAFSNFTLEASGWNPRPTKKERYRQRVFHKFDYFKKIFGENLCVGCGRCIRHCPVKMDISEIVSNAPSGAGK
ncbi:MAG: hypothetical protein COX96_07070 [Candidatus Omnitrophica bacterium CG_4_10_14_0_2_um_filter_44_9]|nr:MAG: hypothetical protein COY78_07310 [Candidatus Omnitrophica bacterium CG_4_10_14_0_8_um_filter_44_12]PIZ83637.1 MAG: hypothetical protein COX96_07070 [Candidatus Omnitrophica bacterium CG_4_10_14_0_2_um_filter_44_9]